MGKPRLKVFATVLLAVAAMAARPARAAGEITLVRANSVLMLDTARVSDLVAAADTNTAQKVYLTLLIQNLAYEKTVQLLIKNDTAWDTVACRWIRQADDDFEYWEARKDFGLANYSGAPKNLEFKLRYVVNKTTYWADNGGKNFKLAKNGGTLLPANAVFLKNCQWQLDTGMNADTSVFSGTAEVRGWKPGASMTLAYTTDYMQTQGFYTVKDVPDSTWLGAAPADSEQVRVYHFRVSGVKLSYSKLPVLNFHLKYWDGAEDWRDDNRQNRYSIMLGSKLDQFIYEELPLPAALGHRAESRNARFPLRSPFTRGSSPVFGAGLRGLVDGMGRSR